MLQKKAVDADQKSLIDFLERSGIAVDFERFSKDLVFNNLCDDSRAAQPDDFFIAIPCARVNENIAQAIEQGATIVLATPETVTASSGKYADHINFIAHPNPRLALSQLAKTFFEYQPKTLVAVTGTNGKSSVVSMLRQFWEHLDYKAASLGTLGIELTKQALSKSHHLPKIPSLTTYGSMTFFSLLRELQQSGIDHAAFEGSSHGLEQYRTHGSDLCVAGFTNLTQDHLDYHQTMEKYFQAKAKLFSEVLQPGKTAVFNAKSDYAKQLIETVTARNIHFITYGIDEEADLKASQIKSHENHITFDLEYKEDIYPNITLNLIGNFQIENTLCAIGMLIASGTDIRDIIPLIPKLKPVLGRMEFIGKTPTDASVYVDYAHTPDALENTLKSLRAHTKNDLWVLFGCGGDRDQLKRPIMGKIAFELADKIIITDDNPRSENASSIREQILAACTQKAREISDRKEAIIYAVTNIKKGDTLLIAGKGHETGQIIGNETLDFSDQKEVQAALKELV